MAVVNFEYALEHMVEELRVQTKECIRLTTAARLAAESDKDQSQRERAVRPRTRSKHPAASRRK